MGPQDTTNGQAPSPVRRVITGHDLEGRPITVQDAPLAGARKIRDGLFVTSVWTTEGAPADISLGGDIVDVATVARGVPPPEKGTRFVIMDIYPHVAPMMHRTESLDYVIVLSGELQVDTGNGPKLSLKAGDVMVLRGSDHAWENTGTVPARIAVVLVDANPIAVGKPVLRGLAVGNN